MFCFHSAVYKFLWLFQSILFPFLQSTRFCGYCQSVYMYLWLIVSLYTCIYGLLSVCIHVSMVYCQSVYMYLWCIYSRVLDFVHFSLLSVCYMYYATFNPWSTVLVNKNKNETLADLLYPITLLSHFAQFPRFLYKWLQFRFWKVSL